MQPEPPPVRRYRRTEFALGTAALAGLPLLFLLGYVPTDDPAATTFRFVGVLVCAAVVGFAAYRLGTLRLYRPDDEVDE